MGPTEYLASRAGVIGRYRSCASLSRGEYAVARDSDGLRLVEVLRPATARHVKHYPDVAGELLRAATEGDLEAARTMAERASAMLARGGELAASLGLAVELLDAEVSFDGGSATMLYLHFEDCDIRDLVRPLSREFDLSLAMTDLTVPPSHGGCGDCGSGGCGSGGCGSGGCGSSVSKEELQAYFAELREKYQRRVPLL